MFRTNVDATTFADLQKTLDWARRLIVVRRHDEIFLTEVSTGYRENRTSVRVYWKADNESPGITFLQDRAARAPFTDLA